MLKLLSWIVVAITFLILFAGYTTNANAAQASADSLVVWMARCDTLTKPTLSWSVGTSVDTGYLFQYARLTGSIPLNLATNYTQEQLDVFVQLADSLNNHAGVVHKKVSLALNYSPYMSYFVGTNPTLELTSAIAVMDTFVNRCNRFKSILAISNAKFASTITVPYLLLDQEKFSGTPTSAAWLDSLTSKMNAIHSRAQTAWPDINVLWYDRGGLHVGAADPDGWAGNNFFSLSESGTNFTCSLYRPWELADMRDTFRYTLENAWRHGVGNVTCYVSLGSGYARHVEGTLPTVFQTWVNDLDYGRWYAWQLGREMHNSWWWQSLRWQRFAPWSYCNIVAFYNSGGPFSDSCPHFGEYFVAFVWGANNNKVVFPAVVP